MKKTVFLWIAILTVLGYGESHSKKQEVQLLPINEEQVPELMASFRGKIVLVNFWATWCGPGVKEFPSLVRLKELYRERGVEAVFISVGVFEDAETAVRPFLQK